MKFNQKRLKDAVIFSAVVTLVQFLLSMYVYPLLKISTSSLFSITAQTAFNSPTIGNKLFGIVTSVVPMSFSLPSILAIFIGVFVLIFGAYTVYDWKFMPKTVMINGKGETGRVLVLLLYATAIGYLVMLLFSGNIAALAVPMLLGLLMNYVFIAVIMSIASKYVPALKV